MFQVHPIFRTYFITPASLALTVLLAGHVSLPRAETETDPVALFDQGQRYYGQGDYAEAKTRFEELVKLAPEVSIYHHWLGKSYGRLAENSGWLDAMSFAKKTLKALKKAVELDEDNTAALVDLMTYYKRAPAFLGGSRKKARAIAKRLQKLQDKENQAPMTDLSGNIN